ncbi:hypothetical protein SAMN05428995_1201, partial [Loktanella sp. DSM 29012]|uniref:hypothetical protein n=1 Tax=Loktanella sp. DSM 29012 TaxID=1881056 RepID=UPI0008D445CD
MLKYEDGSEVWLTDILTNDKEAALSRAAQLLEQTKTDENGCMVTDTQGPRKIRFKGRQVAAYRFIFCVLNHSILT